ncbi:MAG TPA: phytoene/squalene synthase family protein [Myxococcales bacterium]|nr:phytoene/squalene synthase family protein [Myxococcales bacterium]
MTVEACREVLARKSKSFALAARLLPPGVGDDAAVVYAWCRRADDLIDEGPADDTALGRLHEELASIYAGRPQPEPQLAAFQEVALRRAIPRAYLEELLEGMAMDVRGTAYRTLPELLLYCHRVAGTVGLMMCHVMGVRDSWALPRAAHLGLAMQLTNIARDVQEDAARGRTYLPASLLGAGDLKARAEPAVRALLAEADRFYASADQAIPFLDFRCGLAVRTARLVYAEIGRRVEAQGCDVTAGRAVVSGPRKLLLVLKAFVQCVLTSKPFAAAPFAPRTVLRFPDDVLPL